jgi:hypothetical protein
MIGALSASDQKDRFQAAAKAPLQRELTFPQQRELVSRKIHREGSRDKAALRTAAMARSAKSSPRHKIARDIVASRLR